MQLITKRLVLREFEERDWRAILSYQSDPDYLRFYPWTQRSESDVRSYVRMFMNWSKERPRRRYQLVIRLKAEDQLIGNAGLREQFTQTRTADLGYELDRRYWGYGYATEAAQALLQFGFRDLAYHRIWAQCIEENTASAHVLEKIGMRFEGRMHESEWMKGRWWDTRLYALLDHEWAARGTDQLTVQH
jgi:ribosomal-protein-alanine N-acetyltransferase